MIHGVNRDIEFIYLCEVHVRETMTQWTLTETPVRDGECITNSLGFQAHANWVIWTGDTWPVALYYWVVSVSKHGEDTEQYYISNLWKTVSTDGGPFKEKTVMVNPADGSNLQEN